MAKGTWWLLAGAGAAVGVGLLGALMVSAAPAAPEPPPSPAPPPGASLLGSAPWDAARSYQTGEMVSVSAGMLSGSFYEALVASRGVSPESDTTTWRLVAQS